MPMSSRPLSRRTATVATLVVLAGSGLAFASHAKATVPANCTLTDYQKDGQFLTAAQVFVGAGNLAAGAINAAGCNIGVYAPEGTSGTVNTADIEGSQGGPNYYGVLVNGAAVDVTNSHINDVGETPPNGTQHGVAVAYVAGQNTGVSSSGTVSGNDIERYQKGGIVVDNSAVNTTGNNVVGLGPVSFIAQNGVQYSDGATGSIANNEIDRNNYTGCSNKDAAKTGCVPYVSTGLLLYNIDPSAVKASLNKFRDDQRNQYMAPANSVS